MVTVDGAEVPPASASGPVIDAAVALVVAALLSVVSSRVPVPTGQRPLDALAYALFVVAAVAMGTCRHWPRLAVAVTTAVLCTFIIRDYPNGPVWATGWVALAVLAWRSSRRTALVAAVAMFGALTATAMRVGRLGVLLPVVYLGWSAAAIFLGEAARSRRNYLGGLAERARFLERSRDEEAARRVAEERLRIARDLHDSVAHAMASINVQAGAAAHVLTRQPEAAAAALTAIQRASAEVLDELAGMLAVLRADEGRPDRAPAPGLADLRRLGDSLEPSGLVVDLRIEGPTEAISSAVATASYRVVQESLTNVLRHSKARTVCVEVRVGPKHDLEIEVRDPGPPRGDGPARRDGPGGTVGTGVGVQGMRERVTATGGRFAAGVTPDGGFAVRATWDGAR